MLNLSSKYPTDNHKLVYDNHRQKEENSQSAKISSCSIELLEQQSTQTKSSLDKYVSLTEIHVIVVVPEQRAVAWQYRLVEDHHAVRLGPLVGAAFDVGVRARGLTLAFGDHAQL